jgi:hypothetical protein
LSFALRFLSRINLWAAFRAAGWENMMPIEKEKGTIVMSLAYHSGLGFLEESMLSRVDGVRISRHVSHQLRSLGSVDAVLF